MSEDDYKKHDTVIKMAAALGFPIAGFASCEPLDAWEKAAQKRSAQNRPALPEWSLNRLEHDPRRIMSEAKSILILGWPCPPYQGVEEEGTLTCCRFYLENRQWIESMQRLVQKMEQLGIAAKLTFHLPLKPLALRAELGKYGRHGLIIFPQYGTFVRLGSILTNLSIEKTKPKLYNVSEGLCLRCNRCIQACPVKAIERNRGFSQHRCIRQYMLSAETVPLEYRSRMGYALVGCERCQVVCPANSACINSCKQADPELAKLLNIAAILREASEEGLKSRSEALKPMIGANYARPVKLLAAAVIAAGNSRDAKYLTVIEQLKAYPVQRIQEYCRWAIQSITAAQTEQTHKEE